MVRENSRYFAGRVMDVAGADVEEQVEQVYLAALSRWPSAEERKMAGEKIRGFDPILVGASGERNTG